MNANNGVQHLVAMSRDEVIAPLVNILPLDKPGDVYMYIAKHTWDKLAEMESKVPDKSIFDSVFETGRSLQKAYSDAPLGSEEKAIAYQKAAEWRNANRDVRLQMFSVYWMRITSAKDQRKICKRNVMTLGYGGTKYGFGQQVIEDSRDMSEYLRDKEHLWGAMLGALVFDTCYEKLRGPANMLQMFQSLAARVNETGKYLSWNSPITNFPVVQAYRKPVTKRTKLRYGEEELKVQVECWEEASLNEASSKTGASPNIVHSFDAAHLATVVDSADFTVSVIHDSFGSHAGNMHKLFPLVRQKFVELYQSDPLEGLLSQLDSLDLMPERGKLDVTRIMESDYAFC